MVVRPRYVADVRWNDPALLILIAVIALGYYLVVEPTPLSPSPDHSNYNQLTDAILTGQTSLLAKPAPELLALPDPYNPEANARYRLHDMSLYNGNWYMYFGITPVLTLYAPWRLITRHSLPDHLGVFVFGCGALVFGIALLRSLLTAYVPSTSALFFYFFCAVLALANVIPFLLHRPQFYEIAIACGQCFSLLGLWMVFRTMDNPTDWRFPALAGLAFGLAVGARPQLLLAGIAILLLLTAANRTRNILAALIPFGLVLAGLAVYNYARFDSPFEFGNHYQLAGINVRQLAPFRGPAFLTSLYHLLISPLSFGDRFPYIFSAPEPPFRVPADFGLEAIAGIFWIIPYVFALFSVHGIYRKLPSNRGRSFLLAVIVLSAITAILLLVDGTVGATMRYCGDFFSIAYIASVLVIAAWLQSQKTALLRVLVVALGIWTMVVSAALAYNGYYGRA